MSCRVEQRVLRMPASTIGIYSEDEFRQFENEHRDTLCWEPGHFAPALCSFERECYLDYILMDRELSGGEEGFGNHARPLTAEETEKYLPVFRELFPDFTEEQMDTVHLCEYSWYDGTDAPDCY